MDKRRETTARGDLAELEITAALVRSGRRVLRPLSSASRYDLVVDDGDGRFLRIQCKTGIVRQGAVVFRACSVSGHRTRGIAYHGEIDAFGVYCEAIDAVYLVPMEVIPTNRQRVHLRLEPARNGQRQRTRSADDFRIG